MAKYTFSLSVAMKYILTTVTDSWTIACHGQCQTVLVTTRVARWGRTVSQDRTGGTPQHFLLEVRGSTRNSGPFVPLCRDPRSASEWP